MAEIPKCNFCSESGTVPTGWYIRKDKEYEFILDGNSKTCACCDGTKIPVRFHEELGIVKKEG